MEMKSSAGRRSLERSQSVISQEKVLYMKFRKQQLKHGGDRRQQLRSIIWLESRGRKKSPCSLCSSWLGITVQGWAKPQRRRLECGLRLKLLLKYEDSVKKICSTFGWMYGTMED